MAKTGNIHYDQRKDYGNVIYHHSYYKSMNAGKISSKMKETLVATEMCFYRRILRILWGDEVERKTKRKRILIIRIRKRELNFPEHIMRKSD